MKPIRDLSLSITITAVALAWLAHPAFAEQPKIGQRAVTTQELSSAADYWTPERRASAIPRDARATGNAAITPQKQLPSEPVKSSGSGLPEITGGGASAEQDAARENRPFWSPENDGALGTEMAAREEAAIDPGTIEPLGLGTYPYAFARYNVLSILYTGANRKFPYTAVGKLFFTLAGVNYVCSASVIRPHLLLTARHCVYDYNSGVWGTNV